MLFFQAYGLQLWNSKIVDEPAPVLAHSKRGEQVLMFPPDSVDYLFKVIEVLVFLVPDVAERLPQLLNHDADPGAASIRIISN